MAAKTEIRDKVMMLRLNRAELARFQKQAAREPLATWARRILLEHCDRREKSKRKGG